MYNECHCGSYICEDEDICVKCAIEIDFVIREEQDRIEIKNVEDFWESGLEEEGNIVAFAINVYGLEDDS